VDGPTCRFCGEGRGDLVLDLGEQPASDFFPPATDPGPDAVYPLQMWLCAACSLAQLVDDPTTPQEPRGVEPAALVAQAADAVRRADAAGLLPAGARVAEYGSPHGGSWLGPLADRGLRPVADGPADVVVDCFGLMHAADQSAALADRAAQVAADGVLLVQYHSLATIVRDGQWNALRHGHYAYYSMTALTGMLSVHGLRPLTAWRFDLYGGTILLAARPECSSDGPARPDEAVTELMAEERRLGVRDPAVLRGLHRDGQAKARGLRRYLTAERLAGRTVAGYGAASRAVALLRWAEAGRDLLPAVADAAPAKHGRRLPGTDIPIVGPEQLAAAPPASVVLFLADLLPEVRAALPQVERSGGRWVDAETLADR
jgi:hypothetical protein